MFQETENKKCRVCSSMDKVTLVQRVSLPPTTILLKTEEPRCCQHQLFLRCSVCHEYFDPTIVNQNNRTPKSYPAILCSLHQNCKRCQKCGKWIENGKSSCQTCHVFRKPVGGDCPQKNDRANLRDLRRLAMVRAAHQAVPSKIKRSPSKTMLMPITQPHSFRTIWAQDPLESV